MPNPYKGNDKAAYAVEYFASKSMLRDSVYRLHNRGVFEQQQAIERVEREVYPEVPAVVRSNDEVQHYLEKRVTEEVFRRQQRQAARERQFYPQLYERGPVLSGRELEAHLDRLFPGSSTSTQRQRHFRMADDGDEGADERASSSETHHKNSRKSGGERNGKASSQQWRPTYRVQDPPVVLLDSMDQPSPRKIRLTDLEKHNDRIRVLSKPLCITPKAGIHQMLDRSKPLFKVPRRADSFA